MNELILEAGRTERHYWRDLWRYRELFAFLAWRDLLVRYKQTAVGVAWSLIRPVLTMLILALVFGKFGRMPSGGVPYPLLVFCGMLPWQFFSTAISESGNSLVTNSNLISKVYFPRLVVPAASVITSLVDFLISAAFLIVPHDLVSLYAFRKCRIPAPIYRFCVCGLTRGRRVDFSTDGPVPEISASSCRSWSNSVYIFLPSAFKVAWCPSDTGCSTRSIPW